MKKKIYRELFGALREYILAWMFLIASLVCAVFTFYGLTIPKSVSCFADENIPSYLGASFEVEEQEGENGVASVLHGQYKLFGAIPVKSVTVTRLEDVKVYVGGIPFGLKYSTKGVSVVGFEDGSDNPAFCAGLRLYDIITKVNGKDVTGSAELASAVKGKDEIELTYIRAGKESKVRFKPMYSESEKKYVLGLWLKDSGAGIGTLTYVLPDGSFGGLGHGICDSETDSLTPMANGSVLGVTINGLERGKKGEPGELKGYFNSSSIGAIMKNTEVGVFGMLGEIPKEIVNKSYSIGLKGELKEGKATILCTLDDNQRCEYSIEISSINRNASGNKCFSIKVTDPELLAKTGGIVQGMSGSPIIQNGKLVGAVTHVLINDPTAGYGIFIENMLSEMAATEKKAA